MSTLAPALSVRPGAARLSSGEWLLAIVCAYFFGLKLLYSFFAFPIADEAYYWMWGLHPGLSYFDHPPLQGWLEGISHALLGRSLFALRWTTLAAFASNAFVFYRLSRRISGDGWRPLFLKTLAVYLASPLFGWFGSVVFIDYLLVALMLASGYCFYCYLAAVEETGRGPLRLLFGGAALLGFAGLAKYNGAYLGLAIAGTILFRPRLRPLLRAWPIYAAAAIAVLMQVPVLIWNAQHDFASFRFHTTDPVGGGGTFTGFSLSAMKAFALDQTGLLSPFLVPVIVRFFWARPDLSLERIGKTIAIWAFWLSSLTFLYIANYSWVLWWWNIAAYALVLPFAGRYVGRLLLTCHVLFGLVLETVLVVNFAIAPVSTFSGLPNILETDTVYGWDEIAAAVRAAEAQYHPDFLATNRYQSASQLAFALDDPAVTAISSRQDQFDYWWDGPAHLNQSAIIVVDAAGDADSYKAVFASLTKVGEVTASQWGKPLKTYELYYGTGYQAH